MEIKCEYCGSIIKETDEKCPYCGATNQAVKRTADHTPKTIEELQQWYQARNLPPYEVTRFFIGINYTQPKAFGIYREGQNVIVYKNKANGERAIRYQGTDEAYAVNELYLKLKEEILNQKEHNQAGNEANVNRKGNRKNLCLDWSILSFLLWFLCTLCVRYIIPGNWNGTFCCTDCRSAGSSDIRPYRMRVKEEKLGI